MTGGLLHDWRRRNSTATIPHTIEQLRAAGNVANLSRLLEPDPAPYRGRYPFLDTDLYKTLEGLAYDLGDGRAAEPVREFYEEVVGLLERVQAPDGYLNSFFQDPAAARKPWEDLAWGHELYTLGHLIQAAVAAHRRMGDDRLLRVAVRFADLVVSRFGEAGVCGHPEVEMALVELFRETGERGYLTQAARFVDRRGTGALEHSRGRVRARAPQRLRRRPVGGGHGLLLRQPAPAPSRPRAAQRRGARRRAAAAGLVRLPLLPAQHRAVDGPARRPRGGRAGRPPSTRWASNRRTAATSSPASRTAPGCRC
jgi:DUF1680 family protein